MSMVSNKIRVGGACRFCEREFIDRNGNPFNHGNLTVCNDCWLLVRHPHPKYIRACVETINAGNIGELRKSTILREIQAETESDFSALGLEREIIREQNKERFDDLWLPKFKEWLDDQIYWDEKKFCYTLHLERQEEIIVMDFYPKGNKVLVRQWNKWYRNAAQWLVNNVLPEEYQQFESKDSTNDL